MKTESDLQQAEFDAEMAGLRERYLAGLTARRAALAEAWCGCVDHGQDACWQRLREIAHKLSGSAPCYGLPALGEAAREVDGMLSPRTPCRLRARLKRPVERLLSELDAAPDR